MTAHELARQLLAGPDLTIIVGNHDDAGCRFHEVTSVRVGQHADELEGPRGPLLPEEKLTRIRLVHHYNED